MQLTHDGEDVEHLLSRLGCLEPAASFKSCLGDLLASTEALENGTALEAALAKIGMNPAAKILLQIRARFASFLVDRKVGRARKSQGDTT